MQLDENVNISIFLHLKVSLLRCTLHRSCTTASCQTFIYFHVWDGASSWETLLYCSDL